MAQSEENPLELQIDEALAEYMHKCDSGDVPNREEFVAKHPLLREQLMELLAAADWIEQLAGPKISELAVDATADVDSTLITGSQSSPASPSISESTDDTLPHALGFFGQSATQHTLPLGRSSNSLEYSLEENAPTPELSQPTLPCRFGEYVLERVLGRGGMGVVYYGHQVRLERPVAIKMIRSGALASKEEVARFYSEARSAARLDHPNIVTVYQCGECDGHRYFSMDFVPGTDLSKMIESGPIDGKRAARYVRDVARAIQYAHDRGILHRDLKPANVLVDENDQVRITDFGLAKSIGTDTGLTASGAALGTPSYMSPEQAAGKVDEQHHATDIYSLGAVLFTIVTGKPPFKGNGVVQTIMNVIHRPAPMARTLCPDVPEDLETIIDICLQKTPERRYASAAALAEDLNRFLQGSPIAARPASSLRRVWYWLLGIPVIGAVFDNRVVEPTETHRWVQRGLISIAVLFLLMWLAMLLPTDTWKSNRMPKTVRIAGGVAGGSYDMLSDAISNLIRENANCEAISVNSFGTNENAEKLINGDVDLALLQSESIANPTLNIVTPLYYEAVHVLVKRDLPIASLAEFAKRRILLDSEKAGMRTIARLLLARDKLTLEDIIVDDSNWRSLKHSPLADAAIVVAREGSAELVDLIRGGDYRLLPIADSWKFAMEEPIFHMQLLESDSYPGCEMPEGGIPTVATTAFLTCRADAPSVLIESVLQNLFSPEFVSQNGILPATTASQVFGHTLHPAARKFFQAYQGLTLSPN